MSKVTEYIEKCLQSDDDSTVEQWREMEALYNRRLWHQLTVQVLDMIKNSPSMTKPGERVALYQNFVSDFEHRINPLSLAEIACLVCDHMLTVEGEQFMRSILEKVGCMYVGRYLYCYCR